MKIYHLKLMQAKFSKSYCMLLQILPHIRFAQFLANVGTLYLIIKELRCTLSKETRLYKPLVFDLSINEEDCTLDLFKLIERQAARYPDRSFAIPLRPFKNALIEKGLDLIQPSCKCLKWFRGILKSEADISDLADGIVWSPDAHTNSQGAFYKK